PLDGGYAAALHRSISETAEGLGADAAAYRGLMEPSVRDWAAITQDTMMSPVPRLPHHPIATARFGLLGLWPAARLGRRGLETDAARALFAGSAAHSMQPLEKPATASFGLILNMLGHAVGWPVAKGGSQSIAEALASILRAHGGEILTNTNVTSFAQTAGARAVLFDVSPRLVERICGDQLPGRYRRAPPQAPDGPGALQRDQPPSR